MKTFVRSCIRRSLMPHLRNHLELSKTNPSNLSSVLARRRFWRYGGPPDRRQALKRLGQPVVMNPTTGASGTIAKLLQLSKAAPTDTRSAWAQWHHHAGPAVYPKLLIPSRLTTIAAFGTSRLFFWCNDVPSKSTGVLA